MAIAEFAGVTAIETSAGGVTVRLSPGLTTLPSAAVTLLVPGPMPVAKPPAAMVATEVIDDDQVTLFVIVCKLPSL